MKLIINEISDLLIDLINPLLCLVCERPIDEKNNSHLKLVCSKCLAQMPLAPSGDEIINIISQNFDANEFCIDFAHSLIDVRRNIDYIKIIYALKYYSIPEVAEIFGAELAKLIIKSGKKYDYLIPVPIHKAKARERGYNQAKLISDKISNDTNIPILDNLIIRNQYTTSQTLLNHSERKKNLEKVYEINYLKNDIENKNFLIIDDVLTTGTTINNMAIILKSADANIVDCSTIAFA